MSSVVGRRTTEVAGDLRAMPEQRFLLQSIDWQTYDGFLRLLGDRSIRLTYDRGQLELMSPSYEHETYAYLLGRFLDLLTLELNLPMKAGRCTTFRRRDLERGLEADNCYYLKNAPRLFGRREIDLNRDPPPDLAIEVDLSSSSLDRMGIYAALGVPEIWRFDAETLRAYRLTPQGAYEETTESLAFPKLPLAELVPFLQRSAEMDDTELAQEFLSWLRARVVPNWKDSPEKT